MDKNYSLGIDIGGTTIVAALVDQSGNLSFQTERASNTESAETLFHTLVQCIEEVLNTSGLSIYTIHGIGVGVPGNVDIENGIAVFQNNIPWSNFPLVKRLKEEYGDALTFIIDNDVKMAAYAEYKDNNTKPNDLFTYITISTGIAATSILNDKIIRGSGFSGEVGFLPLKTDDGYISLEEYAAGPAIQKAASNVKNTKEVFEKAAKEEVEAIEIINKRAHAIAIGLYSIVCVLDSKTMVLGGSVAYYNPNFIHKIKEELSKFVVPEQAHILESIRPTRLGGDNGVIGAGLRTFN